MHTIYSKRSKHRTALRAATILGVIATFAVSGWGQDKAPGRTAPQVASTAKTATSMTAPAPVFESYRGVRLGMSADEARQKLGRPREKSKTQDLYTFADNESAQVYYDDHEKVYAISVDYTGSSVAPLPKSVLGTDLPSKPDGSIYQLLQYPAAGYWVSYNRTAGQKPIITVTMQKISGDR